MWALLISGCLFNKHSVRPSLNPAPVHPPSSVTGLTDEQFSDIDLNQDGKLDKGEIEKAKPIDSTEHPIKIFALLVGTISIICLIPAIPAIINFYKKNKSSDEKHQ